MRYGDKLIGVYQLHLDNTLLITLTDVKDYLVKSLLTELEKDSSSDLFTYKIMTVNPSLSTDLFGVNTEIVFEFVPNPEVFKDIQEVTFRLQTGL